MTRNTPPQMLPGTDRGESPISPTEIQSTHKHFQQRVFTANNSPPIQGEAWKQHYEFPQPYCESPVFETSTESADAVDATVDAADITCAKNCFCNARTCRRQERMERIVIPWLLKVLILVSQIELAAIQWKSEQQAA